MDRSERARAPAAPGRRPAPGPARVRPAVLALLCTLVAAGAGWAAWQGGRQVGGASSLAVLAGGLALSAGLVWALPGPSLAGERRRTARLRLAGAVAAAAVLLFGASAAARNPGQVLALVVVLQVATLAALRSIGSRREVACAAALAALAGAAALGALHNTRYMPMPVWAAFQVPLTFLGLLAGWSAGRRLRLPDRGLGRVLLLEAGWRPGLAAFVQGLGLAIPFALVGIALGSAETETWVRQWWQPVVAVQPGIAEEAWARVFLLTVLALLFARWTSFRNAWLASMLVGVSWFAYLHVRPGDVVSALLGALLFNLPLTFVWLRRGLDSAIGFHVMMDGLRWTAAFLLLSGR